jgi:hypothetical protein
VATCRAKCVLPTPLVPEGHKTDVGATQEGTGGCHLLSAADEGGQRHWQVGGRMLHDMTVVWSGLGQRLLSTHKHTRLYT